MEKYVFTKLKPYLEKTGVDIAVLVQKARKIDEPSTPSLRTWSAALNDTGVTEKTMGKMKSVIPPALEALKKECPDTALETGPAKPKNKKT